MFRITAVIFSYDKIAKIICSTVDRSVFWEMLRTCCEMLALRSGKVLGLSRLTRCFKCPQRQKSHGLRAGDQGGHRLQRCQLTTRSFVKRFLRVSITQRAMCDGAPSCKKIARVRN
ncbi:hypothetical protein AVEN_264255-1 [Araneus ventricosus]|uniref:Uncharacterized protein n=1 Tax=Araneus ventricosus TaxID=182803 RepID=A0A4Y2KRN6_ARAVE|nr:hypothetical protein AVEN_264255-1 [Araneus ventricosus]